MSVALLINGRSEHRIDVSDRGFQYGDGVFTTLPVRAGRPSFLSLHLARLARDCARLRIRFPGASVLEPEIRQLCRIHPDGVLKIQITRGSGPRGYRPPPEQQPTRVLSLHAGAPAEDRRGQGVMIRLCDQRLSRNPALAGVKHTNRLEQILARAEWDDDVYREGLMLDSAGSVIEGTMSNVFLVQGGRLITPDLSHCGVAGVMRSIVLDLASAADIPVVVRPVTRGELATAAEVFLTNSVIRLWPVVALGSQTWPIGPITEQLADWVDARVAAERGEVAG